MTAQILQQRWENRFAQEAKRIDNRTWKTERRGDLVVDATDDLATGAVVGAVVLTGIRWAQRQVRNCHVWGKVQDHLWRWELSRSSSCPSRSRRPATSVLQNPRGRSEGGTEPVNTRLTHAALTISCADGIHPLKCRDQAGVYDLHFPFERTTDISELLESYTTWLNETAARVRAADANRVRTRIGQPPLLAATAHSTQEDAH